MEVVNNEYLINYLLLQESKKVGKQSFMYAWVLDETDEERNRKQTLF